MSGRAKHKILIVDDEPSICANLSRRLEVCGYTCLTANDGKKGIELAIKSKPSLVILDLMMPEVDGHKAYRILKSNPKTKDIKVIFFTAKDPSLVMGKGIDAIDDLDFIFKPFDDEALMVMIRGVLGSVPLEATGLHE
jgi:CRP/FNR family transcriptional regulator, cyclic AMP receptor protein